LISQSRGLGDVYKRQTENGYAVLIQETGRLAQNN
jgi:hypothetical protein